MKPLTEYQIEELAARFRGWGHPPVHAKRLLVQFYKQSGRIDLAGLNLGRALQQRIRDEISLRTSWIMTSRPSEDGTLKLLLGLEGGGVVETVLMPDYRPDRAAGCISSQIGCAMGCDFCASTLHGLERSLEAGEMVEQFLHLREQAEGIGRRLSTIVFMGMGEPMLNLENVLRAVHQISGQQLGGLGGKQVTISTVGIVPGIDRLADAGLTVNLAVSLHAPDDQTRSRLVPATRRWGVREILAAARRFREKTGRMVMIEYCLLDGVNDSEEQAQMLAGLLEGFRVHVNLIPYNLIGAGLSGASYQPPQPQRVANFLSVLRVKGVMAQCRRARGSDVAAACGQLRESLNVRI